VDFTSGYFWAPLVEEPGQCPHQSSFALAAFAEYHWVVASEYGAFQLRKHRFVKADDARKCGRPRAKSFQQVLAELCLGAATHISGLPKLATCGWLPMQRLAHGPTVRPDPS
jgi:hypothetical protein